uniref:Uncharacterized protein n=1 Tax=Ralstonia solanacearum TaxID=305 RepID=A0A0S4TLW4_RALSL|nr:conserved protein of unknown function [Ralstonia solanacearum]
MKWPGWLAAGGWEDEEEVTAMKIEEESDRLPRSAPATH